MLKSVSYYAVFAVFCFCVTGCAFVPSPVPGFLYTDIKAPVNALHAPQNSTGYSKVGKASVKSILGALATGDASIEAAMKAGGIKKIHHVDHYSESVLGLFGIYTVVVYGE